MEKQKVSGLYNLACVNAHKLLDELYESVHTNDGDPIVTPEELKAVRTKYLAKIRHELELIQSTGDEAHEQV